MSAKPIEMIGRKFGKLTVLELSEYRGKNGRDKYYICSCNCGKENILILGTALRRKSKPTLNCAECGNKKKEKHGGVGTRLYKIWDGMKQRCYNENDKIYHRYGGRGISICEEWLSEFGFHNFMIWAAENGYSDDLTIDRIENDGNYEPNNCRWADMKTQANNKSNNKLIEYNGEIKTLIQWAEYFNIDGEVIRQRLLIGWGIERALTEEVGQSRTKSKKKILINKKQYTYKEISDLTGYSTKQLSKKYCNGVRDERLLEKRKNNG